MQIIKYLKINSLPFSIIISGCFISFAIIMKYDLDVLQKIISILGSLSLVLALVTYFYKKNQDETLAAIEQIKFFREKIIYEWDDVQKSIMDVYPKYWFSRIKINKSTIEGLREEFSINFNNQASIIMDVSDVDSDKWKFGGPLLAKQVFLLNMFEEFSLKVNHFRTHKHPALDSVRPTFVELIEKNAFTIFYMRDIITNNPIYSATLSLYDEWKDNVPKSNFINNLEKHGFITKEQKKKILDKQRKHIN